MVELLVGLGDDLPHQFQHRRLLGQVAVAGVLDVPLVGPLGDVVEPNVQHGGQRLLAVADHQRLLHVGVELQRGLDADGRDCGAVGQLEDVVHPVEDSDVAVVGDGAEVVGVEPPSGSVGRSRLPARSARGDVLDGGLGLLRHVVVAGRDDGPADQQFAARRDADLDVREHLADGLDVDVVVAVHRHEAADLRLAPDLLQRDPEGVVEYEVVLAERAAAGVDVLRALQSELVENRPVGDPV